MILKVCLRVHQSEFGLDLTKSMVTFLVLVTWILFYVFWKLIYIAVVLINSLQDWDQKKVDADFVKETRPKQDCLILYVRDKTLLKI